MKARSLSLILGLITTLALLVGFSASSASASTVSPQSRGLPIEMHYIHIPNTHYFYIELGDGHTDMFPCMPTDLGYSYPSTPIVIGASDCGVRVRLYEFIGQRGWDVCFSPHQTKSVPEEYQYPNEVYIGTSTAAC
jgi:hypothetical protein